MRIWLVPFGELDDRRVVAQHHEWHTIWNAVTVRNMNWLHWSLPQYRYALWTVHQRITYEMRLRGYYDATPVAPSGFLFTSGYVFYRGIPQDPYLPTLEVLQQERWQLLCRWGGEYRGRIPQPELYEPLIWRYRAQGGCTHVGPTEKLHKHVAHKGWELCLDCKNAVRYRNGSWVPKSMLPAKG